MNFNSLKTHTVQSIAECCKVPFGNRDLYVGGGSVENYFLADPGNRREYYICPYCFELA